MGADPCGHQNFLQLCPTSLSLVKHSPAPQEPCDPSSPTNSPDPLQVSTSPPSTQTPYKVPRSSPAPQDPRVSSSSNFPIPSIPTRSSHPLQPHKHPKSPALGFHRQERGDLRDNSAFPSESCWMMHGRIFAANNNCSSIAKPEPPNQYSIAEPGPPNQYLKELLRPGLLGLMWHFGASNQGMCLNSMRLSTNEHLQAGKGISEQRQTSGSLRSPRGH